MSYILFNYLACRSYNVRGLKQDYFFVGVSTITPTTQEHFSNIPPFVFWTSLPQLNFYPNTLLACEQIDNEVQC